MKVKVVFHGVLKNYNNNLSEKIIEVANKLTVSQLVAKTDVPSDEIAFIAVNGSRMQINHLLNEGDEVTLYMPVGGG